MSFPHPCISSLQIKQTQDEEKKQLTALRDLIKSSLQLDQKEVGKFKLVAGEFFTSPPYTELNTAMADLIQLSQSIV